MSEINKRELWMADKSSAGLHYDLSLLLFLIDEMEQHVAEIVYSDNDEIRIIYGQHALDTLGLAKECVENQHEGMPLIDFESPEN